MNTSDIPKIYRKRHFSTSLMSLLFCIVSFMFHIKMFELSNSKKTLKLAEIRFLTIGPLRNIEMDIFKVGNTEFSWQLEGKLPKKLNEFH